MSDNPPTLEMTTPEPSFNFQSNMIAGYVLQLMGISYYISTLTVVYNIRSSDNKSAPFYNIFFVIGLMDVLNLISLMWMDFEKSAIKGEMFVVVTYACSFFTCFCFLCNIIGNGLMAVNRFAATYSAYPKYFSSFRTQLYLSATVVLALVSSCPALFRQRLYAVVDGEWTFTLEPQELIKVQRMIIMGWMIVYFLVALPFTFTAFYRISNFINSSKYHRSDNTLLYFVSGHICLHTFVFLYEFAEIYHPDNAFISFIHRNFYLFLFIAIAMNSVTLSCTTIRVRRGLSKLICRVMNYSKAKVTSSQQTIAVVNVSEATKY